MIELLGGKTAANLDDCLVAAWRVTYAKSWHRGAQCNRRGSYLFPACDETILWKRKKTCLQKWPTCIIKSSQQSQQSRTNGYSTSIRSSSYNIKLYRLYIYHIYIYIIYIYIYISYIYHIYIGFPYMSPPGIPRPTSQVTRVTQSWNECWPSRAGPVTICDIKFHLTTIQNLGEN